MLAAIASSVIPEAAQIGTFAGVIGGFAAGGALMIVLKWLVLKSEKKNKGTHKLPVGLAAAAVVDTILDGAIITTGFLTGNALGVLLVVALSIELLFLTLSVGVELGKSKLQLWQKISITSGIAFMILVGAMIAGFLLQDAPETTLAVVLSFGAAALIYLIAEELLVETIQAEESLFPTATLFSGFLVLLTLKLLS